MVADEMRRDASIYQNEHFVVVFDTFHDRRTGFFFQTNPLGALRDALIVDENTANYDWNAVWDVKVHRDETGWTSEMVIPFKSLRYPTGKEQVWGINARRWERRINEHSLLSITPPGTPPNNAVQRLAIAATLVGIEVPPPARNIELKPYGVSNLTTNRVSAPPFSNEFDGDIGIDAKYGITSNVTLDLTVNTDFAQVEDRRAAGEPDPLQPVLSGEARLLPRGAGHLRLRRSPGRRLPCAGCADHVLLAPHRPRRRPAGPHQRRRAV